MMGYYARMHVDKLPPARDVAMLVGDGEFYACHHQDMDGGYILEIASADKWTTECAAIHILEFFGEAMLEAGGIYVRGGKQSYPKKRSDVWRRAMGYFTFVLDDVDISHPRGLHAVDYSKK